MTSLARATALMTLGTVLSRVTGLLRIAAIAAALGVAESRLPDTYNLANTAPNIIYELVLGGVLTSVFVPVFVELLEKEGRDRAWAVASAILNLSLVVLTVIALVGIVAAPAIARFYVSLRGEGPDVARQAEVMGTLLRMFLPQIVFYGLTAITAGLLNAHKRFGAPMYTPVLNNLAVIVVFLTFHNVYGDVSLADVTTEQLVVLGAGTTAGVVLMAIAQLPFLRGLGRYRATFRAGHPAVRKMARLAIFVIGYVVTNQIAYVIVQLLAARQQGGYSAYVNAFTFFMLPHGLFAVSIITALLPDLSEQAVRESWDGFRARLSVGVRTTMLLVLPAAVGYLVLAEPTVRFLLERGVMTPASSELVAGVLRVFVIGLVPFSVFQLLLRAFYAMQDPKTPFLINCGAVAVQTGINVAAFGAFGVRGLAAGHAGSYLVGALVQGEVLRRRVGGLDGRRIAASAVKILGAAAAMGLLVHVAFRALQTELGGTSGGRGIALIGAVVVGAASYLAAARLLRVEELSFVADIVRRRRSGAGG